MDNHPPQQDPWDPQRNLDDPATSGGDPAPPGPQPPVQQHPPVPPAYGQPPAYHYQQPQQPQYQTPSPGAQSPANQAVQGGAPPAHEVAVDGVRHVPAGLWWRIGAFLIDAVVLVIAHQILLFIVGYVPPDADELMGLLERMLSEMMARGDFSDATYNQIADLQRLSMFTGWLNVAICAAYYTVFHGMLGATLGKLSLGLVVLKRDGSPLGYGVALVRYMGYFIVAKLLYTAWMIPFNREKRTIYDMLLGTNVYRQLPNN